MTKELPTLPVDGSACTSIEVTSISKETNETEHITYLRNGRLIHRYFGMIYIKSKSRSSLIVYCISKKLTMIVRDVTSSTRQDSSCWVTAQLSCHLQAKESLNKSLEAHVNLGPYYETSSWAGLTPEPRPPHFPALLKPCRCYSRGPCIALEQMRGNYQVPSPF